jgi:anaerobic magnesium-protoporphyrin IX monomethyl ester cyclase
MKITFVAIGCEQLAISLLAGICKRNGHEVQVAYSAGLFHDRYNLEIPWLGNLFDDKQIVIDEVKEQKPDIVAFSCLTATYQWALSVAREIKKHSPNTKTVFGGVHISAVPERVIKKDEVDFVVVGEGEEAFPLIIEAIENNDFSVPIDNTIFKKANGETVRGCQKGFYQELDTLPWYDKSIWDDFIRINDKYMTMTSRGCPYRCSFCFNNFFAKLPDDSKNKGKYVRIRSVDHVIEELKWAKKRYKKIKYIDFQDDVFTTSKKWLREFAVKYKQEIDIPYQCLTHPKYMDEEVAQLLSYSGCVWIQMGVQSMDDDYKIKLLRFERSDNIEEACRVMAEYGIKAKLDHMFGLPDEPISAQAKALDLYRKYPPSRIQTFWTCFLPGTDLLKEGLEKGHIKPEEAEKLYEGDEFYFFRIDGHLKDRKVVDLYKAYNFVFKILPFLSFKRRMKIQPQDVMWIPLWVRALIIFTVDLYGGFRHGNPDFYSYFKHNMFHIRRFITWKLTGKKIKPSTLRNNLTFLDSYSKYARKQQKAVESAIQSNDEGISLTA